MKSIKNSLCAALCGALLFSATPVRAWFFDTVANWVSPKVALVTASVAAVAVWYLWPKKKKDKKHKIREKEIVANLTPPQLQQSQNNDEVDEHERALPLEQQKISPNQRKSVAFSHASQRVIPRTEPQENFVLGATSLLKMPIPTGADEETKSDEHYEDEEVLLKRAAGTMSDSASMEDPNHIVKISTLNQLPRTQLAQKERFDLQQQEHVNGVTIPKGIFQITVLVKEKINTRSNNTGKTIEKNKAKTYMLVHEKTGQQFTVKFEKTVEDKKLSRYFVLTEIEQAPRTILAFMAHLSNSRRAK